MWLRDELGAIYTDEDFADVYPQRGQPALAPWRLAVVTLLQYLDDLTDRQAGSHSEPGWRACRAWFRWRQQLDGAQL